MLGPSHGSVRRAALEHVKATSAIEGPVDSWTRERAFETFCTEVLEAFVVNPSLETLVLRIDALAVPESPFDKSAIATAYQAVSGATYQARLEVKGATLREWALEGEGFLQNRLPLNKMGVGHLVVRSEDPVVKAFLQWVDSDIDDATRHREHVLPLMREMELSFDPQDFGQQEAA